MPKKMIYRIGEANEEYWELYMKLKPIMKYNYDESSISFSVFETEFDGRKYKIKNDLENGIPYCIEYVDLITTSKTGEQIISIDGKNENIKDEIQQVFINNCNRALVIKTESYELWYDNLENINIFRPSRIYSIDEKKFIEMD